MTIYTNNNYLIGILITLGILGLINLYIYYKLAFEYRKTVKLIYKYGSKGFKNLSSMMQLSLLTIHVASGFWSLVWFSLYMSSLKKYKKDKKDSQNIADVNNRGALTLVFLIINFLTTLVIVSAIKYMELIF